MEENNVWRLFRKLCEKCPLYSGQYFFGCRHVGEFPLCSRAKRVFEVMTRAHTEDEEEALVKDLNKWIKSHARTR